MAINFPSNPVNGQIYYDTNSGNRYFYESTAGRWVYAANNEPFPIASDKQVLFNNAGGLDGSPGLTFDTSSNTTFVNDINVANNITGVNSVFFDTSTDAAKETVATGELTWNPDDYTLDLGVNTAIMQIGQEIYYRVKNQTGSMIPNGTVVMAAGTLGASGRILIAPAIADGSYPSKYVMGVTTQDIADGGEGFVTSFGKIRGLDTSMWSAGDILYANPAVAGGLSNTMPLAPNTKTTVAIVVNKHANNGEIFIRPTYGSKLNEDELVELSALANGDILAYVTANGRFENKPYDTYLPNTSNAVFVGDLRVKGNVYVGSNTVTITNNSISLETLVATNIVVNGSAIPSGATSNLAFDTANSGYNLANNVYASVNSAFGVINAAYTSSNADYTLTNAAYTSANANYVVTNAAFTQANTDNVRLSAAYVSLNAAFSVANAAYGNANSVAISANAYAGFMANASNTFARTIVDANLIVARAYTNTSVTAANNYAGAMVNAANAYANSTYVKLSSSSQTISGDLSITGNLNILGSTVTHNTDSFVVRDPLVLLASNNTADIVDIGFIAHYANLTNDIVHTGFFRDHESKEWFIFKDYNVHALDYDGHISTTGNNFTIDVLNASLRTSNLNLGGANAIVWIKTAFDTVNAAYTSSNADYVLTNAAYTSINAGYTVANAAFGVANSRVSSVSGTGTVSGLTLSGTVTSSGSLTLGGTLSTSIDNITDEHRLFNNMGDNHSTYTDFNSISNFGVRYVQGSTNGPGTGDSQFYGFSLGLGNEFAYSLYAYQIAFPRYLTTDKYISVRNREGGTWGSWTKIAAGVADAPSGSIFSASGSLRAPIFYDSDNTSFYADLTSTGDSVISAGNIRLGSRLLFNACDAYTGGSYALIGLSWGGAAGTYKNFAVYDYSNGRSMFEIAGETRNVTTYGNFFAPIFYDSNNTARYVDPTGTSVFGGQIQSYSGTAASFYVGDGAGASSYNYIMAAANDTGNKLTMFVNGSSRSADGGVNAVTIRNDGGVLNLGHASYETKLYGNARLHGNYLYVNPTSTFYMICDQGPGTFVIGDDDIVNLATSSSTRTPILYDYNNTAYYFNGDGSTVLYRLTVGTGAATQYNESSMTVYGGSTPGITATGGWGRYGKAIVCQTDGGGGQDGPMVWFHKQAAKSWGCGVRPYSGDNGFWISEDSTNAAWGTERFRILPGGQVNIFAPDGGWNSRPALCIASNGDGYLQTRHIRGKDTTGTGVDHLYIQWDQAADVYLGRHLYSLNYYDRNDTNYVIDPNGNSTFLTIYHNGGTAFFRGGQGVDQCCGDDGAVSIGGNSTKPPRIAWHSAGIMEGTIEANATGWRKIYFFDMQGSGLGVHATGQIASNGNVIAYYSDRRLKEDFEKVTDHWNVINNVSGYRFTWNKRAAEIPGFVSNVGKREVGLIAQEVLEVYPEAVYTRTEGPEDDPYKTILHDRFNPIFIEALKDLRREIDELKNEIRELKNGK
jgi:hypothetical protein